MNWVQKEDLDLGTDEISCLKFTRDSLLDFSIEREGPLPTTIKEKSGFSLFLDYVSRLLK